MHISLESDHQPKPANNDNEYIDGWTVIRSHPRLNLQADQIRTAKSIHIVPVILEYLGMTGVLLSSTAINDKLKGRTSKVCEYSASS